MLILNEKTITEITDPVELTDVMEKAMLTYASGDFIMPDRSHMDINGNTLLSMPSSHGDFFSTKLVSLFPDNPKNNEPVLYGTVILNDGNNGKALALLNGARVTALRTAAVGSVGIRHTAPKEASTLGLIGAGVQGFNQIIFACKNRPIQKVTIFDAYNKDLHGFIKKLRILLPKVEFSIAKTRTEVCEKSEIIITATNSTSPVLPDDPSLLNGRSIIAIGSYKPGMVELPDSLFPLLDHFFIDVKMATEESGDLIHPLSKGLITNDKIHILSEVISGDIRIDPLETSLYKSVGMALFDLFAAKYLYNKAVEKGLGEKVEF